MIDNNALIKLVRLNDNYKIDWTDKVLSIKKELTELLTKSFPGINFNCVSLVNITQLKRNDEFIFYRRNLPSFLLKVNLNESNTLKSSIERVGNGFGLVEDYFSIDLSSDKEININNNINEITEGNGYLFDNWIIKIDVNPTDDGGSGYYYFYKTPTDLRLNLNNIFDYIK